MLSLAVSACSIFSGKDGVTLNDGVIVAGENTPKKQPEPEPPKPVSKYDAILPATDFADEPEEFGESAQQTSAQNIRVETTSVVVPLDEQPYADREDTEAGEIKPVVLLDHSYTLRLGLFESHKLATEFARDNELDVKEAGISKVMIEGQVFYLLAFGIYGDLVQARDAAEKLTDTMGDSVTVVSLASVKEISEWDEESEGLILR